MVILNSNIYLNILDFFKNYTGLSIECDEALVHAFPKVPLSTLRSIQSKYGQNLIKDFYSKKHKNFTSILMEYERRVKDEWTIVEMSKEIKVPPLCICRMILSEKFSKILVKEMIKNPDLIPDPLLSANVFTCIFNDNQDGPIIDMVRYTIGEEYEIKLKQLAREAGLTFYDEGDLRRDGFDKTPDLLLAIQCLYKNNVINWIESKASFGDMESHSRYLNDQLQSYTNRFGAGIVIYWFGLHEDILTSNKSSNLIIILDNFPLPNEFEKLTFDNSV